MEIKLKNKNMKGNRFITAQLNRQGHDLTQQLSFPPSAIIYAGLLEDVKTKGHDHCHP